MLPNMTLNKIIEAFREGLLDFLNEDLDETDPNYIKVNIDEPPETEYITRRVVLEVADQDGFGYDENRQYINLIISLWFNRGNINKDRQDTDNFSFIDAQSEAMELQRALKIQSLFPFATEFMPLPVEKYDTEDDLIVYALPFKVYLQIVH